MALHGSHARTGTREHGPRDPKQRDELYRIWTGLDHEMPFKEFAASAKFVHKGIALTTHESDPDIWWVHVYAPRRFSIRNARATIVAAAMLGCRRLIARADVPVSERLLDYLGFEQGDGLWQLRIS